MYVASDTVNHDILLDKFYKLGRNGYSEYRNILWKGHNTHDALEEIQATQNKKVIFKVRECIYEGNL